MILERNSLEVEEIDLFDALRRWSAAECQRKGLDVSPENQKFVLEDAVSLIRFPLMTEEEFTLSVVPFNLLSDNEAAAMSLHFQRVNPRRSTRVSKTPPPFSGNRVSKKRRSSLPFCNKPRAKNTVLRINPGNTANDLISDKARTGGTFSVTVKNVSALKEYRLSPSFYVRNLPWNILVKQHSSERDKKKQFGFFLQCNGKSKSGIWSCFATAELKMLPRRAGVEPITRKIQHLFFSKENDWGFSCFMHWNDMLDPNKGYIKDDSVILEVHLTAEEPNGL